MAKFIKKRFPILFVGTYFIVALSMVGFLIYPLLFTEASVAADFTNNGAATATWGPSYTDRLVMDVTIPDAWSGGAYTADTLYWDAGVVDNWQGDTLNAFPAIGTTTGVGYVEDLVDVGFQTTEAVVADLDADSVVTSAADDLVDADGSGSTGIGTINPAAAAGDPLLTMGNDIGHGAVAVCADSLFPWVLTAVRIDLDGDCSNNGSNDGTYIIGTNATAAGTETNGTWAFGDAVTMGGNNDGDYDDGEDIFYENNVGELTYSAGADGTYIVGAGAGSVISNFPADCNGAGAGSEACKYTGAGAFDGNSNIYIDGGTAGGATPNSVVDRQDDLFTGIGVQNTGTAVNVTDISQVRVWVDAGAAGFQGLGTDTSLGVMTVNSGDTKEWRLGGLAQAVAATVGQRIFVTVDLTATPTTARTLKFQIPVYNDAGADGVATADDDVGVFMESTNDGPTNAVVLNANTQTIDSASPTISSRVTSDNDNDGHIDRITFTTNENLDDDFTGLTITVNGYIVESYSTGGSANDNIFLVIFTEGGTFDTGATPDTQITVNSSLGDAYTNNIAVDGAPVASTDGAIPTIGTITYKDEDGDGKIDRIMLTYTETVTIGSVVSANDLVFDNVGSFTGAVFGVDATDLVTGSVTFTNINLGTESSVIATYDATTLLAISTQNAFSLVDGSANTTLLQGSQTQATVADGAAPVLGGDGGIQMYLDNSSDGSVETFQTWWSENVTMTGSTTDDWTIVGGDLNASFSAAADDAGGNQVINVTVTADPNRTGATSAPTISYDNGDANGSVKDTALNPAGTTGPQTLTDGAAPRPVSAAYKDANGDGTVDRIDVTMTAEASLSCTFQAADWSIPTAGTVVGANTPSACAVSGNDIQVTVAATSDVTGGGTDPTINYSNIAPKGSVIDAGNLNQAPSFAAPVTAADAATPAILTSTSSDQTGDGTVDRVVLTFSETVDITDTNGAADGFDGITLSDSCVVDATNDYTANSVSTMTLSDLTGCTAGSTSITVEATYVLAGVLMDIDDEALTPLEMANGEVSPTGIDGAAPVVLNTYSVDTDGDGDVNAVDITFSENITDTSVVAANFELDNDSTDNATGEEAVSGESTTVVYPGADADANDQYYRLTVTTGITGTELVYLHHNTLGLTDASPALNQMALADAVGTENDEADPIVMSTSPADAATGVALDASFSITFSEAMTTTDITTTTLGRTPTFTLGSVNGTWTASDTVVTFASHDPWAGLQIYSIDLVQGSINSAATGDGTLDVSSVVVADPYTFTTVAATSGGSGGGGAGLPASVTVLSPNGGEVWAGSSNKNITWSSTSSAITKVKLFYSLDRGVNFPYTIATDENSDGTYSWTVPNIPSGTVKVKVEGYDASNVFVASDISDADFTITYTTPPPPGAETPPGAGSSAGLVAGDLLKSPMSTTVYYYGSDNKRHIFPNEKTYKTWYPDWSNVRSVTAAELQAIPLGKNVTVRPGTVLVKIDTDSKVYAVEPNGLLRWIPTEVRIKTLYGADWAKKIIDVPLAFWGDYSFGSDISTDAHPTGALVQYSGTTEIYYIQGAEKRKITTAGFAANNFRSEYVFAIPTTLYYAPGADIIGGESALTSIY